MDARRESEPTLMKNPTTTERTSDRELVVSRTFSDVLRCPASTRCCLSASEKQSGLLSGLLDSFSLRPHQLCYPTAPEFQ